jgi:hypothetical protein
MKHRLTTRKHKLLSGYSKEDLDKAETYLNDNNLMKPPLIFSISLAFYPIIFIIANKPFGEKLYQTVTFGNQYLGLFILIIPLVVAIKTAENHQVKVVLEYFKKMKTQSQIKKTSRRDEISTDTLNVK